MRGQQHGLNENGDRERERESSGESSGGQCFEMTAVDEMDGWM